MIPLHTIIAYGLGIVAAIAFIVIILRMFRDG